MKTKKNIENGTYEIVGLNEMQFAAISAIINSAKWDSEEQNNGDDEIAVEIILSNDEVEILQSIDDIEFPC